MRNHTTGRRLKGGQWKREGGWDGEGVPAHVACARRVGKIAYVWKLAVKLKHERLHCRTKRGGEGEVVVARLARHTEQEG